MKKVIQILCHTLNNDDTLQYHIFGNWSTRQARSILNYSKKYKCEVWYVIRNLKEPKIIHKENITIKLFPATSLYPLLESFFGIISAPQLLNDLANEDPKSTIIHFQGERGTLLHSVLKRYSYFPITLQCHGYGQPSWLDFLENIFIKPLERENFRHIKHFFVHIQRKISYLKNELHILPENISFQNNGVDFTIFQPNDKTESRKRLKLPIDKFIILYVGGMTKTKGVDKIMNAYRTLKQKYPQLYLIFIGVNKIDPLYQEAQATADRLLGLIENKQTVHYYNSADAYCFFGNKKTVEYAGVGTAPTEALACNVNVISTNLIHFPPDVSEKAGLIPESYQDFVQKIEYLILNPTIRFNAREKVAPYASYEYTTKNIIKKYGQILNSHQK